MNPAQFVVITSRGCHTGKTVGGVANTPRSDQKAYCFPHRECYELTQEEAKGRFHYGSHQTPSAAFSTMYARRTNREALFLRARTYSLCNNSGSGPMEVGQGLTTPKHWNKTTPQHSTATTPRQQFRQKVNYPTSAPRVSGRPNVNHNHCPQALENLVLVTGFTHFKAQMA